MNHHRFKPIKVMVVFGTRPEAIKMAPLVLALAKDSERFEPTVVVTAQHREMLDQVLDTFQIVPDYDLNIMGHRQTLTDITVQAMSKLQTIVTEVQPDIMLVHGDTTTTLAASLVSITLGMVDFSPVLEAAWFELPGFILPFKTGAFQSFELYFGPEMLAILPISIVTVAEHIGDHTVLSHICGREFLKNPGLNRTLIGDGVATAVSALLGGPANTTYGENTGVVGMTRIASVSVIRNAALIAITFSFLGKFTALISTIPNAVLGGMSILLYGVIASNGLKVLIESRVDFGQVRNLIIASSMLVLGLGGAVLNLGALTLSGTALSAIVGVVLNLILPKSEK